MSFNLTFARLFVAAVVLFVSAKVAHSQPPADAPASVASLVKRLGSENFVDRQLASKLLFDKGPAIRGELESVELSSNPELNQRVSDLIKLLSVAPDSIASKETYDAVLNFDTAELETRKQLLEKLLSGEQYAMYFRMIEQMPVEQAEDIFTENRLRRLIQVLCEKDNWDDVNTILSHPLTWKYEPELCGLYHKTMGTLGVYIDKMKREIDDAEIAEPIQLATLIGLLKSEKDYKTALRYAQQFSGVDVINAYENQILMESGDWKTLADRAVLNDDPIESDRYLICNRMTYPLVKYWGGSEEDFLSAVEKVTEKSIEEDDGDKEEDEDELDEAETFAVDPILQQIYLLTLDWEKAKKGVTFTEDKDTVKLLSFLDKYDRLFKELKLGNDLKGRRRWAADKQAAIAKLTQKFSTTAVRNSRETRRELFDEINGELEYYLEICDLLAELGMEEDATLFVRQMYQLIYPVQEMVTTRLDLIGRVADYGDADALWDFVENAGLTNPQMKWLVNTPRPLGGGTDDKKYVLFGFKVDVAQFVYQKLSPKFDDQIELLKHVAHVVNYQLKPGDLSSSSDPQKVAEPFSLDADVAMIDHSFGSDECWKISQIYAYHQRPESKQWLEKAAANGDNRAIRQIANELFDDHDYEAAALMFEQEHQQTKTSLPLSRAAEAYGLAGDSLKAKRLAFHAFVLPDFFYDNHFDETYGAYLTDERSDLVADRLLYRFSTGSVSNQNVLLEKSWTVLAKPDPVAASNLFRMWVLAISSYAKPVGLVQLATYSHEMDATAAVVKGEYEVADRLLKRLLDFSPSSPSIAEKTVVQLDLAGQTEIADKVIDRLADSYHKLLQRYPVSSTHCNNYAWVLACGKRYPDAAIRHAKTAVKRRPNNPGFIDTLAESYYADGNFDDAIAVINRAAAIEPEKAYYVKQRLKYEAAK